MNDLQLEKLTAQRKAKAKPRVDRDVTPRKPNTSGLNIQPAPYRKAPFLTREPQLPFEDVNPFDLNEQFKTLWDIKRKQRVWGLPQQIPNWQSYRPEYHL